MRNPQNSAGSVPNVLTSANILTQKKEQKSLLLESVIPAGFEPTTHSLEGCCSIQLSYGTNSLKCPPPFTCRLSTPLRCITTSTQGRLQHFSGAKLHKIY